MDQWEEEIKKLLIPKTSQVKRKSQGVLKHDYLVPSGPYDQQWDWDAFFIGMAISTWIPTEAAYLKNITCNIMEQADDEGFCPGCLKPEGPTKVLKHVKPFVAQGAYLASERLHDYSWLKEYYTVLKKVVGYRERISWHKVYGLASWWDAMESGADNNVSLFNYPENSIIAPDLNTFLYLEYRAFAKISEELGYVSESTEFLEKSEKIKQAINQYLWCEEDGIYHTLNTKDGSFIKHISYSGVVPLWAYIPDEKRARILIEQNVLCPDKLYSPHGIRTLAVGDKFYNQENIITPYSNWQGPVWPIANYLHILGLQHYGYKKEAKEIARRVCENCIRDIKMSGGMHECYNADTGESLAAPDFISWNLLLMNLPEELTQESHPLSGLLPICL